MKIFFPIFVLAVLLIGTTLPAAAGQPAADKSGESQLPQPPDSLLFRNLKARSIGPAIMGGRVSCIALDPEDGATFYVGLGTGGIMKTGDNGATFSGIFEKEAVAAIGAIAIAPSNAKQVWAGTGEANDRNSSSWGNGIYRSTDAGGSWKNMGLTATKTIARIAINPKDTNTVYVAAMGDLWIKNPERGLYKTTDGGKTWNCILTGPKEYRDVVGCGDVAIDTANPSIIYAALYARLRTPWSFTAGPACTGGSDAGGIFKSTDAGATWNKLTNGLPGETGRIGLDIYKKNTAVVYAIVQSSEGGAGDIDNVRSRHGGVFRSTDRGDHWTRMSPLDPRPFYFSQIRVDPTNEKRIYVAGFLLHVSDDSGKTWQEDYFDKVHPDCHELVVDPKNPKRILLGTDGGAYQSYHGGKGWLHFNTMAAGEFYRVTTDNSTPYRVAGGLQDNSNWVGPSRTFSHDGIMNSDWLNIGGGDGFYCAFDPTDPDIIYAESQQGALHRYNFKTGEIKGLRPEQSEGQPGFRFHWTSPLVTAIHDSGAIYLGGNRIFKLTKKGEQWTLISPDLSAHQPERLGTVGSGAENYAVVYTISESPIQAGMLWAGTDDGKLWLTTDEGKTWTDLTDRIPKAARGQWISRVEAGHADAKVAYLAIDGHRSGIYSPMLYRTSNNGRDWEKISTDLPPEGPAKVVREDPFNSSILYAGTEFGLFVSTNMGGHWAKFGDLPTVAVDDITIQQRERDLVIATHGRSLYIIDDIRPLEELKDSIPTKPAWLFPIKPARGFSPALGSADWGGIQTFRSANPPEGAVLSYYVRSYTGDGVSISITNDAGQTVANLSGPGAPGFNRLTWDLRWSQEFNNGYGGEGQRFVHSGEYTATLNFGKTSNPQKFRVNIDPGYETK
jgi:photosystem II stability/assembly factor-like uncharacterized protein